MNDFLLQGVNALALADDLVGLQIKKGDADTDGRVMLLKLQLEHVLEQARDIAGLNPDGTFEAVPAGERAARKKAAR